ncbi:hypothetical protein A9K66_28215 [Mesorhizobium sp. AA23]|nr:hypothetical protein A9K66_28215 [Mesorhizobium sp. AA23]
MDTRVFICTDASHGDANWFIAIGRILAGRCRQCSGLIGTAPIPRRSFFWCGPEAPHQHLEHDVRKAAIISARCSGE